MNDTENRSPYVSAHHVGELEAQLATARAEAEHWRTLAEKYHANALDGMRDKDERISDERARAEALRKERDDAARGWKDNAEQNLKLHERLEAADADASALRASNAQALALLKVWRNSEKTREELYALLDQTTAFLNAAPADALAAVKLAAENMRHATWCASLALRDGLRCDCGAERALDALKKQFPGLVP